MKANNDVSSPFMIDNGFKRGDAMFPVLFNIALDRVIRKIPRTETLNRDGENILIAYADDTAWSLGNHERMFRVLPKNR